MSASQQLPALRDAIRQEINRPTASGLKVRRQMRDSHSAVLTTTSGPGAVAARDAHVGVLASADANSEEALRHFATGQALAFEFMQRRRNAHSAEDDELARRLQAEEEAHAGGEARRLRMREAMGDSALARALAAGDTPSQPRDDPKDDEALARLLTEEEGGAPPTGPGAGGQDLSQLADEELDQLLGPGALADLSPPPTHRQPSAAPAPAPGGPADLSALSDDELNRLLASGQLAMFAPAPSHPPAAATRGAMTTAPTAKKQWGFSVLSPCFSFAMNPDLSQQQMDQFDAGNKICLSRSIAGAFDPSGEPVYVELVNPLLAFRPRYAAILDLTPSVDQVYVPPAPLASPRIYET